jgi:hypothetical protein
MYYYFMVESLPADSPLRSVLPSLASAKSAITRLQITQFYIDILALFCFDIFIPDCRQRLIDLFAADKTAPIKVAAIFGVPAVLIRLFSDFYRRSYTKERSQ